MEKLESIIIFAIIYGALLAVASLFIDGKDFFLTALIFLGLIGIGFNGLRIYFSSHFYKFVREIPIKITHACVGHARSADYGHYVYFPVIEYEYSTNATVIKSDTIYWDFDSAFTGRGLLGKTKEKEIKHVQKTLNKLVKIEKAYQVVFYSSKVYLDMHLSRSRRHYFYTQMAFSFVIIVVSGYYLLM